MFSFFKKSHVSIRSVVIPTFGWQEIESNPAVIKWLSPNQDAILSINFFNLKPDLPTIKNDKVIRDFYRAQLAPANGGLVQVDIVDIKGIAGVKSIFKIKQQDAPMVYLASITLPFENYSFVIKIQAIESGITGMRDAVILNKLIASGEVQIKGQETEGWFADPYDDSHCCGILMNKSEQQLYDSDFPDHPLSVNRSLIEQIQKDIFFEPEIFKISKFNR